MLRILLLLVVIGFIIFGVNYMDENPEFKEWVKSTIPDNEFEEEAESRVPENSSHDTEGNDLIIEETSQNDSEGDQEDSSIDTEEDSQSEETSTNDNKKDFIDPISDKTKSVERAIITYTNYERSISGKSVLKKDPRLANVARNHSLNMVKNDFFSHENLIGESPTDRAIRHGYDVHKELGGGRYSEGIAENIGKIPTGDLKGGGYVSNDADSIGEAHVDGWMESPGHRKNILETRYDFIGVGCAYDGIFYVCTQNFK